MTEWIGITWAINECNGNSKNLSKTFISSMLPSSRTKISILPVNEKLKDLYFRGNFIFRWIWAYLHIIIQNFLIWQMFTYPKVKKRRLFVVDSKSVPILWLSIIENLNLIKYIFTVNVSYEQFLSDFVILFYRYELSTQLTISKSKIT